MCVCVLIIFYFFSRNSDFFFKKFFFRKLLLHNIPKHDIVLFTFHIAHVFLPSSGYE